MVQKTTPQRGRGRPPAFDREDVVSSAMLTFWSKGFEATTLSDLEDATGVDRSTLYNSFGGKKGLYETAADGYVDLAGAQLFDPLHTGTSGIDDVVEMVDRLEASYRSGAPQGCYIVNDMPSVPPFDARVRYLHGLESGVAAALDRAAALGEVDQSIVEAKARTLTAAIIGINVIHKATGEAVYPVMDALRAELRELRS